MSRELLGIGALAVLCIALVPFFNRYTKSEASRILTVKPEEARVMLIDETVKTERPKTIVMIRNSFPPITYAGSELSDYEAMIYLQKRGHDVYLFLGNYAVPEYKGLKLYKLNFSDPFCQNILESADAIFISEFIKSHKDNIYNYLQQKQSPVFMNIHVANQFGWLLQQKTPMPLIIVFNSKMTHDNEHTIHKNFIMYPYVNIEPFKKLRNHTIRSSTVTLINCNRNKGGDMLVSLAKQMPNTNFIGVKGGYGEQVIETTLPNLRYIETTPDIANVLKQTGILIMPSNSETWGRTAVEAMAAGVPVIHSESQGLLECVAGAGMMCVHDDESAWAEAIEKINREPAFREQLRQRGFKRVEEIDVLQKRGRQTLAYVIESL
jgi:glycosyltransferase involved in cell wall biosynthesis